MASGPITSWQIDGKKKMETVTNFIFLGSKITADCDCSHGIKRHLLLGRKAMTILDSVLKTETHFADKVLYNQSSGFSSSHAQMWELDHKEDWVPKNWHFWTMDLKKTLGSPLDSKEIQPVNPKENQLWIFIRRTDFEAETLILWPPDVINWLIWRSLMLGKIEGRKKRGKKGWDGWMASPTQWTWVRVNSGSWWWTGMPGVLRFMTEQLNCTELKEAE